MLDPRLGRVSGYLKKGIWLTERYTAHRIYHGSQNEPAIREDLLWGASNCSVMLSKRRVCQNVLEHHRNCLPFISQIVDQTSTHFVDLIYTNIFGCSQNTSACSSRLLGSNNATECNADLKLARKFPIDDVSLLLATDCH